MAKMYFVDKTALRYFNDKLQARYKTKASDGHTHEGLLDENLTKFISSIKDSDVSGIASGTLVAKETTLTFDTGIEIVDSNDILVYTTVYGISPTEIQIDGSQVTITFAKRYEDMDVIVVVK